MKAMKMRTSIHLLNRNMFSRCKDFLESTAIFSPGIIFKAIVTYTLLFVLFHSLKRCCQKNYKAQNALHLVIGCHGSQPTQLCMTWDKLTLKGKELAVYWTRTLVT